MLFVLLFYSGSAKYKLGLKPTHMQTLFCDQTCFMSGIKILSPQLSQHGLSGSAGKGAAFLWKEEKNGCLALGLFLSFLALFQARH